MGDKPEWVGPIGQKIGELMTAKMWTPADLSRRSGVVHKTITRIINDEYARGPELETLRAVLAVFGKDGVQALRDVGQNAWADTLASEITETTETSDDELSQRVRQYVREHLQELLGDINKPS